MTLREALRSQSLPADTITGLAAVAVPTVTLTVALPRESPEATLVPEAIRAISLPMAANQIRTRSNSLRMEISKLRTDSSNLHTGSCSRLTATNRHTGPADTTEGVITIVLPSTAVTTMGSPLMVTPNPKTLVTARLPTGDPNTAMGDPLHMTLGSTVPMAGRMGSKTRAMPDRLTALGLLTSAIREVLPGSTVITAGPLGTISLLISTGDRVTVETTTAMAYLGISERRRVA